MRVVCITCELCLDNFLAKQQEMKQVNKHRFSTLSLSRLTENIDGEDEEEGEGEGEGSSPYIDDSNHISSKIVHVAISETIFVLLLRYLQTSGELECYHYAKSKTTNQTTRKRD